jgi:hypothetical protein
VLNRVLGTDPTQIDGSLLANGLVYIVNPAGVFFGGKAIIDVGGLIAAAGDLSDADFLAGVDHFTNLTGSVENRGAIEAGAVALLGRTVANHGNIVARNGTIAMVAGEDVFLTTLGGRIAVLVDGVGEDPGTPAIENSGSVDAAAGDVVFTTGDMYSLALNHTGITRGGEIRLAGGAGGLVQVSGELDVSDASPGATGGRVEVRGEKVALLGARIDASGDAGGGEVRIGGDFQGRGPGPNAARTFVDADTEIRADALGEGDGGTVIVWADEATGFHGAIRARGGERGGDGGFAEVSGKGTLAFRGDVDLGASAGSTGTLLLDPRDIAIEGGSGGTDDAQLDPDIPNVSDPAGAILFGDDPGASFTISEDKIETTDANIVLEATNSITVSGTFGDDDVRIADGRDLTMRTLNDAAGEIDGIDLTGSSAGADLEFETSGGGTITVESGSGGVGGGGLAPGAAPVILSALTTGGGDVNVNAEGDVTVAAIDAAGGDVELTSTAGSILDDGIDATAIGGRDITLTANAAGRSIGAAATPSDDIDISPSRVLTASASNGAGGIFITADGDIRVKSVDAGTGSVVLEATAGSINEAGNDLEVDIRGSAVTLRALDEIGGGLPVSIEALAALDLGGVTNLTLDTDASFNVSTSEILTDLTVTVDPAGADNTYELVDNAGDGPSLTFAVEDVGSDLMVAEVGANATGTGKLDFALTSDSGDVKIGTLDAGNGAVTLVATAGSINDVGNDLDVDIRATAVTLRALDEIGGGLPVSIEALAALDLGGVTNLTLDTDASFDVSTSGILTDLTVTVDPAGADNTYELVDNSGAGPSLTFAVEDTGSDLTVADVSANAEGTGNLNFALTSDSGDVSIGAVDAGAGTLSLEAADGSVLDGSSSVVGGDLVLTAGGADASVGEQASPIEVTLSGALSASASAGAGGVFVAESGDMRVASVEADSGPVVLEATAGSINDAGDDRDVDISGALVTLTARDEIGGGVTPKSIDVLGALEVASTSLDVSTTGTGDTHQIVLRESDGTELTDLHTEEDAITVLSTTGTLTVGSVTPGGDALIRSGGDIVIGTGTPGEIAVQMQPGKGLTVMADLGGEGGSILDGVAGEASARIDMGDGTNDLEGLILVAQDGIGEEGDPIGTKGVGRLAAATDEGGIFIENADSGDIRLTTVDNPNPRPNTQTLRGAGVSVTGQGGDISITNTGGSIEIARALERRQIGPSVFDVQVPAIRASAGVGVTLEASEIVFDAPDSSELVPTVSTGGSQTYDGVVELLRDAVLHSDGNVSFESTVDTSTSTDGGEPVVQDGAEPVLTVRAWHTTTFEGNVGGVRALGGLITLSADPDGPGRTAINGGSVITKGAQSYGTAVRLGSDTTFTALSVEGREGTVTFGSTLDGGGAEMEADGNVRFLGDVGAEAALSHLTVDTFGDIQFGGIASGGTEPGDPETGEGEPVPVEITGDRRVITGDGGILLNTESEVTESEVQIPKVASIYNGGGSLSFETSGAFEMGRKENENQKEKLTAVGDLAIRAKSAYLGDLSALEITVDAESITLLGREAGDVRRPDGSFTPDDGMDVVANAVTFTSAPDWDGHGRTPIIATPTGGVNSPEGLGDVEVRLLRQGGGQLTTADFYFSSVDDSGASRTVLDLAAAGPTALGNPASETVREGEPVAPFQEARLGQGQPAPPTQASADEVLAFLECAPLAAGGAQPSACAGRALPPVAAGAPPPARSVLAKERALEVAALYRQLIRGGQPSAGVRDALRTAAKHYRQRSRSEEVDGAAFREYLEVSADRVDQRALAHLNRLTAFSTRLGLLGLAERDFRVVQSSVLEEFASGVGAPGLSAEVLAQAVIANFPGVLP